MITRKASKRWPRNASVTSLAPDLNLSVLARYLLILLCCASADVFSAQSPTVDSGLIDLQKWDKSGLVRLSGDYEFYWQQHIEPRQFLVNRPDAPEYIAVPGTWENDERNGTGHATYRVRVLLPDVDQYALKLPDIGTAYDLYLNGSLSFSAGSAGTSADTTVPKYLPGTLTFTPHTPRIELVFHVSNYHYRMGGIWLPILIGTEESIERHAEQQWALDLLLFGAIVIIGLYNLALFGLRREDPSSLYLGIFCLLLSARLMTVGERYLTQVADLPFDWFVRIEYLSWTLAISAFAAFVHSVLPREFPKLIALIMHAMVTLASAVILLTPVEVFNMIVPPFQLATIACMVAGSIAFVMAIVRKRDGAIILTFAYAVLFYAVVNDILVNTGIIDTFLLLDAGLLVFIFFQSMLISYRFTNSFKLIESQRAILEATNLQLRTQEKLRRKAEVQTAGLNKQLPLSIKMETIEQLIASIQHPLSTSVEKLPSGPQKILDDLLILASNNGANASRLSLSNLLDQIAAEHGNVEIAEENPAQATKELSDINCDPRRLKRLLTAVIGFYNAFDARKIIIDSRQERVASKALFFGDVHEGSYLVIGITSEGLEGVPPEALETMFSVESTLSQLTAHDTGLGMSVAWDTIHDLNGSIDASYLEGDELRIEYYIAL